MTKDILLRDLEQSTTQLLEMLSRFTPENFNDKPSATEWSAAEVAEHLLKLEVVASKAMKAESAPAGRAADEKVSYLKGRMQDEAKRQAPAPVQPSGEPKEMTALVAQLKTQRRLAQEAIETCNMEEACVGMPHPVAGVMTRLEWVYFTIHHTERHLKQLRRLAERVAV